MAKLLLTRIFLIKSLKLKVTRFLSKILRASAITMDGMKITFSPFSQFSKISEALELILGLSVNHHRSACVSAIKFMILKLNIAVKRLLGGGNIHVGDIYPFDNAL